MEEQVLKDTINYVYKEIIPKNNILVENRQFVYFEKYDYKFHWNREDSVIEIYKNYKRIKCNYFFIIY